MSDAYENKFDQAFLVTNDSDLIGPLRFLRGRFPKKKIKVIVPPLRRHSKELWALATHTAAIQQLHLEKCLLPAQAKDAQGVVLFVRPRDYDPRAWTTRPTDRHGYETEKRRALERWADRLAEIVRDGTKAQKVVRLR